MEDPLQDKAETRHHSPLRVWQRRNLPRLRCLDFDPSPYTDVTVVAYSFPPPGQEELWFTWLESALLQTWRMLGVMKTVLVVHRRFSAVEAFCRRWEHVEIQVEPTLEPGNIWSMTEDCIERLGSRFETRYCLIVQDDGFPIKANLKDFLGRWDYIGAPFVRNLPRQYLAEVIGFASGNGGFSLRSRRLCRAVSFLWRRGWRRICRKENWFRSEDIFYTVTLRIFMPFYRVVYRFAPVWQAARFSVDVEVGRSPDCRPFGFHGIETFSVLEEKGWAPGDVEDA